jgi:nucleoid DNA-binding protein
MESYSFEQVAKALATVVRRRLVRGDAVELPGVGTLDVRHERSTTIERESGETMLHPPSDHVVFTPTDDQ